MAEASGYVDPGEQSRACMAATLAEITDPDPAHKERDVGATDDVLGGASGVRRTWRGHRMRASSKQYMRRAGQHSVLMSLTVCMQVKPRWEAPAVDALGRQNDG